MGGDLYLHATAVIVSEAILKYVGEWVVPQVSEKCVISFWYGIDIKKEMEGA